MEDVDKTDLKLTKFEAGGKEYFTAHVKEISNGEQAVIAMSDNEVGFFRFTTFQGGEKFHVLQCTSPESIVALVDTFLQK